MAIASRRAADLMLGSGQLAPSPRVAAPNVLACADAAKGMGLTTIAFTGFDGGRLVNLAEFLVHVPTRIAAHGPVEDVHLAVNHLITEQLKGAKLCGTNKSRQPGGSPNVVSVIDL